MKALTLFRRFPKLHLAIPENQEILADRESYPALLEDFAVLDTVLLPVFREQDGQAIFFQNRHRLTSVGLIVGSVLTSLLGILTPLLPGVWAGTAESVVAAALAAVTILSGSDHLERYLNARLAAEELRGVAFHLLSRAEPYAGEDRIAVLTERVSDIGQNVPRTASPKIAVAPHAQEPCLEIGAPGDERERQFQALYRRFRYQDQLRFYRSRQREFASAQRQAQWVSLGLMLLTTLAAGLETVPVTWVSVVCRLAAAIGPLLVIGLSAYSGLYGFAQQAKLYQDAVHNLERLLPLGLHTSLEAVEAILETEQAQWGQLAKELRWKGASHAD